MNDDTHYLSDNVNNQNYLTVNSSDSEKHNKWSQNNFIKVVANNYVLSSMNHQKVKTYQFSMNTRDQKME